MFFGCVCPAEQISAHLLLVSDKILALIAPLSRSLLELSTWQNCAVGNLVHVSHFNPEASGKAQQKVECGEWGGGERGSNVSIGKG